MLPPTAGYAYTHSCIYYDRLREWLVLSFVSKMVTKYVRCEFG